jgi:hypothetical protein
MPTIKINTDKYTPNVCAIEAVSMWMFRNYMERNYQSERDFTVKSGRKIKVKELAQKKGMSVCSCSFKVTRIDT